MLSIMWSNRSSHTVLVEMQDGKATLEHSYIVSRKGKKYLSSVPTISLLGINSRKIKTYGRLKNNCFKQPKPEKNHMSMWIN